MEVEKEACISQGQRWAGWVYQLCLWLGKQYARGDSYFPVENNVDDIMVKEGKMLVWTEKAAEKEFCTSLLGIRNSLSLGSRCILIFGSR